MTIEALPFFAVGLLSVAIFWCFPARYAQDGVAAFTGLSLFLIMPATAIVMLSSIVLVQQAIARFERSSWSTPVTAVAILSLVVVFFLSRAPGSAIGGIVGIAYSTLRHIHVLAEWRLGRIAAPTLGAYFRYHMLPSVLVAGPIHRLPHFERQCERRRWNTKEFFSGAERALVGFALIVIVGEYLIGGKVRALLGPEPHRDFLIVWLDSAIDWLRIYATFVGLTDIALGLSLMIGLRLEENFNKPWRARNLVEFWARWHITLSLWCRDYVYTPVAIWFRSPLIGILCAMLALGLWHETSLYYVVWGAYQAGGIVLTHLYKRIGDPLRLARLPEHLKAIFLPLAILVWLSSARPVITSIVGGGVL